MTPWVGWKTPRWPCAFCAVVPASPACFIVCGATRPSSPQTIALDMFDGMVCRCFSDFTGLRRSMPRGSKHLWVSRMQVFVCAPRPTMLQQLIWRRGRPHCAQPLTLMQASPWTRARPALAVAAAVAAFNAQVDPARAITIAHQSRRCHQQRCWRHPADVYLPAFAGGPAAFDFAIALASQQAGAAAEAYVRPQRAPSSDV